MSWIFTVLVIILIIAGLIFVFWNLWTNFVVSKSNKWPVIKGLVTNIYVVPTSGANKGQQLRPQDIVIRNNTEKYKPYVEYIYRVNGNEYSNDKIGYTMTPELTAEEVRRDYLNHREGSEVDVHYDPSNPQYSYLYSSKQNWIGMIYGLGLLVLGGLVWALGALCSNKSKTKKLKYGKDGYSKDELNLRDGNVPYNNYNKEDLVDDLINNIQNK
jgi:hypothetical protein